MSNQIIVAMDGSCRGRKFCVMGIYCPKCGRRKSKKHKLCHKCERRDRKHNNGSSKEINRK